MKTIGLVGGGVLGALLAVGCSSSSVSPVPEVDGGDAGHRTDARTPKKDGAMPGVDAARDAKKPTTDATKPVADAAKDVKTTPDSGGEADAATDAKKPIHEAGSDATGDGGPPTRHVLVTYNGAPTSTTSAMFAVNLTTRAIDGTLTIGGTDSVTDTSNASAPFVMNDQLDVIDRVDPTTWHIDGSWSVALPGDAGGNLSYPWAVVVATESQVYVVRNGSNVIDVLDTTTAPDGGKPTAQIDLSGLVQPNTGGTVGAAAAAYVPTSKLLYVVLQNVAPTFVDGDLLCAPTVATVVAVDTTTNTLVRLGDAGPGGAIALHGYDPIEQGAVYDAQNHRLLVFEAGCNAAPTTDGGAPGALTGRGVEEIDLTTNTSKILLEANGQGYPGNLVYIDEHDAVVGFSYPTAAFKWDPTTTTLGDPLPNAPELFDYDGAGNLVGAVVNYGDGGAAVTNIVSMSLSTGAVTTLRSNVVNVDNGWLASVGVWPRP